MVPTADFCGHQSDSRQHYERHPQSQLNIRADGYHGIRCLHILATVATSLRYAWQLRERYSSLKGLCSSYIFHNQTLLWYHAICRLTSQILASIGGCTFVHLNGFIWNHGILLLVPRPFESPQTLIQRVWGRDYPALLHETICSYNFHGRHLGYYFQ